MFYDLYIVTHLYSCKLPQAIGPDTTTKKYSLQFFVIKFLCHKVVLVGQIIWLQRTLVDTQFQHLMVRILEIGYFDYKQFLMSKSCNIV